VLETLGGIVNCNQNMEKCGMSEFSAMMIKVVELVVERGAKCCV